jgi:hypothetical protein
LEEKGIPALFDITVADDSKNDGEEISEKD